MSAATSLPPRRPAVTFRQLSFGIVNAVATLAVVLTLGLLAWSALGPDAARVGLTAAFATAVVGGVVYALLGSSSVPAAGPSSATALVLAALVARLVADPQLGGGAPAVLAVAALAALAVVGCGVLQLALAGAGVARLARYVPQPVLAGFMNGVALLILAAQIPPLFGLPRSASLADLGTLAQVQPQALLIGATAAAAVWLAQWRLPRVPAPLVGLAAGCAVYALLAAAPGAPPTVATVGALPGGALLPTALLPLGDPAVTALLARHAPAVLATAAVLAVIGALETLLAAAAIDQLTRTRHDPRRELLAIGATNIAAGLCGGLPAVMLRARSVGLADANALGRAPVLAGSAAYALLLTFGGPLLAALPVPVLAGIMVTIAVALIDRWTRRLAGQALAGDRSPDLWISLAVVALVGVTTLVLGFVAAVGLGVVLSMAVLIRAMGRSMVRSRGSAAERPSRRIYTAEQETALAWQRPAIRVLELEGALFFGNAERLAREAESLPADCRFLVLDLTRVGTLDDTGAVQLEQLHHHLAQRGVALLLAGVQADLPHGRRLLAWGCFADPALRDWWPDLDRAVEAAERRLLAAGGQPPLTAPVALADCSLLRGLAPGQAARVQALMPRREVPAGTLLLRAGDPGDCLYVLVEGSISISDARHPARQRYVSFSPGVMLGEIAMLDGRPRTADAVADVDSVVHVLTRACLEVLLARDPAIGSRLLRNIALHLADRLRAAGAAWRASGA